MMLSPGTPEEWLAHTLTNATQHKHRAIINEMLEWDSIADWANQEMRREEARGLFAERDRIEKRLADITKTSQEEAKKHYRKGRNND
jgi:hypothetical protein